MSDSSDHDKKIDELLKLLKHAPALNGGFDKLSDAVENIKDTNAKVLYELQIVKTNQDINTKKIKDMHKALYDPDDGLYTRVIITTKENKCQNQNISEIKQKTEEIENVQEKLVRKLEAIEEKQGAIERITGQDLQELRSTIIIRKNIMRALWVFTAAVIAGLSKFLWDILMEIF